LDSLVLYVFAALLWIASSMAGATPATMYLLQTFVGMLASAVYYVALTARNGATWGKAAFGLTVTNQDGSRVEWSTAFWRWCAYLPSYLVLGVGFLMAGWNPEKRALHDYLVGTQVVRRPGAAAIGLRVIWISAAICVALLVVGGYFGISWMKKGADELDKQKPELQAMGTAFAEGTDQNGCMAEGLARLRGASLKEEVRISFFTDACVAAARPSERFCQNVPSDKAIVAASLWSARTCTELGRSGDQQCGRFLGVMTRFCEKSAGESGAKP
jgi:uncharacterized RDD family membrane protein YckC